MSENQNTSPSNLVSLTIDGIEVSVAPGTKLITAAEQAHKSIPHFCYHPGLSIAGQCRMCFVEIEGMPKLATACSTPVAPGMKVHTQSEKVKAGQNSTLEFTLLNHPLDCPICDRGGECKLQDYTYDYGLPSSRLVDDKRHLEKAYALGDTIVLDQERCILCTRCVRFSSEVDGRAQLVVNGRGNTNVIDVFEDKPFDSPFSGNVVDLCPVGALTAKDYRFVARPWELVKHDGVCTSCSMGCNVELHTKHRHAGIPRPDGKPPIPELVRLMPKENLNVNEWWMCDRGRWGYHYHNDLQNRMTNPLMRRSSGDELVEVSLKEIQLKLEQLSEAHLQHEWEFWISDTTPHEEITWAKEIFASWNARGRKIAPINDSAWARRFMEYWKSRAASAWFAGETNWSQIKTIISPWASYRDLETVVPVLSLKLGQKIRSQQISWKQQDWDSLSKTKSDSSTAWIVPVPRTEDELKALEKISPDANVLIAWTNANSRGLLNEGIVPVEAQSQHLKGKTPKGPVFYFGQSNDKPIDETFGYYLVQAKSLVVADSFKNKLLEKAEVALPLTPLYESKMTMTSVENRRQHSKGIHLHHPNVPSIERGGEVLNPALRLI